jgi:hypothetical protein
MPGLVPGIHAQPERPCLRPVDGLDTPGTARKGRPSGGGHDGKDKSIFNAGGINRRWRRAASGSCVRTASHDFISRGRNSVGKDLRVEIRSRTSAAASCPS